MILYRRLGSVNADLKLIHFGINPWNWTTCDKEFKPLAWQVVIQTALAIHSLRQSASHLAL